MLSNASCKRKMWKWNTEYTKKSGNNTGSYAGKSITYLGGEQYERVQKAYGLCSAG